MQADLSLAPLRPKSSTRIANCASYRLLLHLLYNRRRTWGEYGYLCEIPEKPAAGSPGHGQHLT